MTNQQKNYYLNKKTIAYASMLGGVEVKDIVYGIEDHMVVVVNAWAGNKSVHQLKVNYNANGDAYITYKGTRIPLSEMLRN